jgi:hypothetical protein
MLPRSEAKPGGEVAPFGEDFWRRRQSYYRRSANWADAGNSCQSLGCFICADLLAQLPVETCDPLVESGDSFR